MAGHVMCSSAECSSVLFRNMGPRAIAKRKTAVRRPIWIAEHRPSEEHHVSLSGSDDLFRLLRLRDHSDGGGGDLGLGANGGREWHLIPRPELDLRVRNHSA